MWSALSTKQHCKHPVRAPTLGPWIWEREEVCAQEHTARRASAAHYSAICCSGGHGAVSEVSAFHLNSFLPSL